MGLTLGIIGAVGAVGSAATGIMGGIGTRNAAGKAGEAQQRYLQQGYDFQQDVYGDTKENMQPWIGTGQQAVDALGQFTGLPGHGGAAGSGALASYKQFQETPYYTFPLAQNIETMDRAAAAKGLSLSEGQLQSLGKAAGGYSASNFGSYITALQNLSGLGATTAGNLGQAGNQAAQNIAGISGQQATSAGNTIMGQQTGTNQMLGGISDLFKTVGGIAGGLDKATSSGYGGGLGNTYGAGLLSGVTGANIGGPAVGTETMTPYWNGLMQGSSIFGTSSQAPSNAFSPAGQLGGSIPLPAGWVKPAGFYST